MTVVIDALDECEGDDIEEIINLLLQTDTSAVVPLKFLVTSRFEPSIRFSFQNVQGKIKRFLLHEIPERIIKRDIAIFLESRLAKIRRNSKLDSSWPDKANLQKLLEKSIPLFIFAATACRFIEDCYEGEGGPDDRFQMILQHKAHGIFNKTYLPILDHMVHKQRGSRLGRTISDFKLIVGSIVTLSNPLGAAPLATLLNIPTSRIQSRLEPLHSVLHVPTDATRPVRIFHESFRDFLIRPDPEDVHQFYIDEKAAHKTLADKCLELLSLDGSLKKDICGLESPGQSRGILDQQTVNRCLPSEAQYACLYWVHHLKGSQETLHGKHQVLQFLQSHFLHWLEALSLMGRISDSLMLIDELLGLVDRDHYTALSGFVLDAKRFILKNREVADDTPLQLYCSGLIFAPQTAIIRREFEHPHWIYQFPVVDKSWSSEMGIFEGYSGSVHSVAFSPDGVLLASGSNDHDICLWNIAKNKHKTLKGHSMYVYSVAFSPNGMLLASGSSDSTVRLWDTVTGTHRIFKGHLKSISSVAFSPDGVLLASGSFDKTVRLWNTVTGTYRIIEEHSRSVHSVAFSPDGILLASGSNDHNICLWNTAKNKYQTLKGHSGCVNSVAFSPNGTLLASGSDDNTVRLWDTVTGTHQIIENHSDGVNSVAFSPDGALLAFGSNDNTICLRNTAINKHQTLKGHSGWIQSIAFSPDGALLASGSKDDTVRLWNTMDKYQNPKDHLGSVLSMAFSPDGALLVSGSSDTTVRLWNTTTGTHQTLQGHSGSVDLVAFSPNGVLLASGSYDKTVRLWDTATGTHRILKGHSGYIRSLAFSPNGALLASGSQDNTIRVWDTVTDMYRIFEGHSGSVNSVAFSPDGTLLASASGFYDNTVRLWDTATGTHRTLEGHSASTPLLAFSPDGALLASGSHHNTVHLWDTATDAHQTLIVNGPVTVLYFGHDGSYLVINQHFVDIQSEPEIHASRSNHPNPAIFIEQDWITLNGKKVLWLPREARATSSAIHGNLLALGHASGLVSFIGFKA
ncbi:unnamed protein product [Penicillium bialowiezense]